jgi:hypothetical protein
MRITYILSGFPSSLLLDTDIVDNGNYGIQVSQYLPMSTNGILTSQSLSTQPKSCTETMTRGDWTQLQGKGSGWK